MPEPSLLVRRFVRILLYQLERDGRFTTFAVNLNPKAEKVEIGAEVLGEVGEPLCATLAVTWAEIDLSAMPLIQLARRAVLGIEAKMDQWREEQGRPR